MALGIDDAAAAALTLVNKGVDRIWPDPTEEERLKIERLKVENAQALEMAKLPLSAIIEEARSTDPYTSRARPSFLYVVYILILAALPMSAIFAISPITANHLAEGMKLWFESIPKPIYELFQFVMLGYIAGRSMEKIKGIK